MRANNNMVENIRELDEVWRILKPFGRFQLFQMVFIVLHSIPACFAILSAVFTGYVAPDFTCNELDEENTTSITGVNVTYEYGKCNYDILERYGNTSTLMETKNCDRFTYKQVNSYATEWNLVCSRTHMAALAQSLVLAGQGIGALTMSHLSDRFGRKTIHVVSHIGVCLTMFVMAGSQNILMLSILRLVAGTFQQGIVCTGKVLALEMFPKESRAFMEAITFLAWAVGMMVLCLFGFAFRTLDWRYLQIGLACFSLYAFVEWWLIDESVRWLLSNGKAQQAERVLRKAARWNKVDFRLVEATWTQTESLTSTSQSGDTVAEVVEEKLPIEEDNDSVTSLSSQTDSSSKVKHYTIIDMLKNPSLRINTFILWYTWLVATGTYYGLTLVSTHLAGDRFINFFLSGLIEVPALVGEMYLFNKIGRKRTLILFFTTAGVAMITSTVLLTAVVQVKAVKILANIFSLIGKMAITGSFSTCFLYTPEIYPTNYRNSGLGIASSISRIGGILAPFASNLALIALWIPGTIFGCMCLLVSLLALRLPESAKHELPRTIAEIDVWKDDSESRESSDREMMECGNKA